MNRVVILTYAPTYDQNHESQAAELANYAAGKGYEVVEVIQKTLSAVEDNTFRADTQRLLELAAAKGVNKVLIRKNISLLGNNAAQILSALNELHGQGVSMVLTDYDQAETLTDSGKLSDLGKTLISALSNMVAVATERRKKYIKAGIAEARRNGKQIGRPAGTPKDTAAILKKYPKVVKGLKRKLTVRDTARLCGVSVSTVQKIKNLL